MPLRLFEHPVSPYARKVKIVLYEKGIPFERIYVSLRQPGQDASYQEFVLASPRREVPCLVDGDLRIFDSTIMLEYLEEKWPQPASDPSTPAERARVRMLETLVDVDFDPVVWALAEIRVFQRAKGELADTLVAEIERQLEGLWARLERELEGREFLNGASFGRGDAAVIPHIAGATLLGFPVPDAAPRLQSWFARGGERESVKKDAEEAAEGVRRDFAATAGDADPVARVYRDHRLEWMFRSGGRAIVEEGLEKGTIAFAQSFTDES